MSKSAIHTGCVLMTGPDVQMDHRGDSYEPANPLPVRCPHCTFPDLDFVARPYVLTRGVSSPAETALAHFGNFLVRERVRRVLELAIPGACAFHPTAQRKGNKSAPWWLAVPKRTLETPVPKPNPPFCPKCHEPKLWCYATADSWARMCRYDSGGVDVFKSASWYSCQTAEDDYKETNRYRKECGLPPLPWSDWAVDPPPHAQRWTRRMLYRELYFSVRLEQLFKRVKIKGQLVRLLDFKDVKPSDEDEAWICERLNLLSEHGLAETPKTASPKTTTAGEKWFHQFLKRNARKADKRPDFTAVEKKHGLTLPSDYKAFISAVGPKSFENVNGIEGFTANVLPPNKVDFKNYRRGRVPYLDKEQSQIDGLMFASTDHGDCFVFEVSKREKDYPVFWYDHEQNSLEPFATNFTECIKRFAQGN